MGAPTCWTGLTGGVSKHPGPVPLHFVCSHLVCLPLLGAAGRKQGAEEPLPQRIVRAQHAVRASTHHASCAQVALGLCPAQHPALLSTSSPTSHLALPRMHREAKDAPSPLPSNGVRAHPKLPAPSAVSKPRSLMERVAALERACPQVSHGWPCVVVQLGMCMFLRARACVHLHAFSLVDACTDGTTRARSCGYGCGCRRCLARERRLDEHMVCVDVCVCLGVAGVEGGHYEWLHVR